MSETARIPFVRVRHHEPPNPDGCRWCGYDKGGHGMQITRGAGLHTWVSPTPAQRAARMKARRNLRIRAVAEQLQARYVTLTDERGVTHVRERAVLGWTSVMAMSTEEALAEQEAAS